MKDRRPYCWWGWRTSTEHDVRSSIYRPRRRNWRRESVQRPDIGQKRSFDALLGRGLVSRRQTPVALAPLPRHEEAADLRSCGMDVKPSALDPRRLVSSAFCSSSSPVRSRPTRFFERSTKPGLGDDATYVSTGRPVLVFERRSFEGGMGCGMNTAAGHWRPTSDGSSPPFLRGRDGWRLLESHDFKRKPVCGETCRKPTCMSECTAGT
ncbi:hypothetical protein CMUS01_08035 [Colletotrichum musicola]|uniref:Uncharacterized protein n=1 Tax=Colletotrichum musicola TaxID=2175873 RepID=A0A8H6KDT2_9PEZI|nr:hypothetical protein CMUS01_08035 [Colletotrichum musicola]